MKLSRAEKQRLALSRRVEKQTRHNAIVAQHAAFKAEVAAYEAAYDAWTAADCVGPQPIHPLYARGR